MASRQKKGVDTTQILSSYPPDVMHTEGKNLRLPMFIQYVDHLGVNMS